MAIAAGEQMPLCTPEILSIDLRTASRLRAPEPEECQITGLGRSVTSAGPFSVPLYAISKAVVSFSVLPCPPGSANA